MIDDKYISNFASGPDAGYSRGLVPRDYKAHPVGSYEGIEPFPDALLIDRSEWQDRLAKQKKEKARLLDVRNRGWEGKPIPSRDQDGKGYCWAHGPVSCLLLLDALMNEPYIDYSPFAIACMVKNFRDQGGNAIEAIEFIASKGVPSSKFWPQQSMDRKNDNPETWANAKKHQYRKWYDLESGNLDQQISCYLRNMPIAGDCNAWSHSLCYHSLEDVDPKRPENLTDWVWNSWADVWQEKGMGKMQGSKAKPNAMTACCVATASQD